MVDSSCCVGWPELTTTQALGLGMRLANCILLIKAD